MFPITNAFIQIVDDVIGMMFWAEPQGPRITLWDWKSGKFLIDRSSLQLPSGTWDFSFLSSRAYMLTCTAGQGSIEIFTFADETRNDSTTASIGALPVHVASLLLPPVLPGVHLMNMHTHTGPFAARCPVGKPFATANHARIHVVSIQYARTGCLRLIDSPRFCLFVHNRTLMSYIHQRKERGGSAVTVPWNKWGPLQTQFMHQREQFQWLRYVQGCRVVLPISYHVAGSTVQVLDFNVCRTKRQIFEEHTASSADSCINTDGTHVGMGNIFQAPVITLMPYRVLSRGELEEYNGVMIDDERLIGLKYPAFSEGDMKDIHVFTF
ncbi:hypothetical protein SERLA73DRAFT_184538 [Serpula lacrymans var. lacrymans S7.3]|uniref:Uncharacterized protein n=1 Tax=Serpula lacrymans var. lacrymans (strain S7.3) TaxID=936435 RepID=F8Q3F8_SERL3|nr:hypothetical protein SERLA73DRAFT_184538 [Serpula lacrymans var. lacrymans S7.3]